MRKARAAEVVRGPRRKYSGKTLVEHWALNLHSPELVPKELWGQRLVVVDGVAFVPTDRSANGAVCQTHRLILRAKVRAGARPKAERQNSRGSSVFAEPKPLESAGALTPCAQRDTSPRKINHLGRPIMIKKVSSVVLLLAAAPACHTARTDPEPSATPPAAAQRSQCSKANGGTDVPVEFRGESHRTFVERCRIGNLPASARAHEPGVSGRSDRGHRWQRPGEPTRGAIDGGLTSRRILLSG